MLTHQTRAYLDQFRGVPTASVEIYRDPQPDTAEIEFSIADATMTPAERIISHMKSLKRPATATELAGLVHFPSSYRDVMYRLRKSGAVVKSGPGEFVLGRG